MTSTSRYDAFGNETGTTGGTDNVRRFSTKERSDLLALDYFGFRYYDPELGRFITRDPSGYPDGPNNYLYCNNSPVNKIDPLGLFSDEIPEEERQRMLENQRRNREEVEKMKTQPKGFFSGLGQRLYSDYDLSLPEGEIKNPRVHSLYDNGTVDNKRLDDAIDKWDDARSKLAMTAPGVLMNAGTAAVQIDSLSPRRKAFSFTSGWFRFETCEAGGYIGTGGD